MPLYRAAGSDASHIFNALHPPGTLESAPDDEVVLVGDVDPATVKLAPTPQQAEKIAEQKPTLEQIIGLPDFEVGSDNKLLGRYLTSLSLLLRKCSTPKLGRICLQVVPMRLRFVAIVRHGTMCSSGLGCL